AIGGAPHLTVHATLEVVLETGDLLVEDAGEGALIVAAGPHGGAADRARTVVVLDPDPRILVLLVAGGRQGATLGPRTDAAVAANVDREDGLTAHDVIAVLLKLSEED